MSITKNSYWRSRKGLRYEELALDYLQHEGLQLLQRNFRCKAGEIDLVMLHRTTLVFIEVRFRNSALHGSPVATITRDKQRKLLLAARYFLLGHAEHHHRSCRFDVVGVMPDASGGSSFDWVPDAFC